MISHALRHTWNALAALCSVAAFVFVLENDSSTAFAVAVSGLAFFLVGNVPYPDFDDDF